MKDKTVIVILACLFGGALFAHTSDQAYEVASYLVDRYKGSSDWIDDLDTSSDEVFEVEFPTADSLFACEFPSNSYGAALSTHERRQAFDQFLIDMSRTNEVDMSRAYRLTGGYALVFCADRSYTNGFCAATNILARSAAPCRSLAYTVVRRLACPSMEMSAYVYTLLTNRVTYSAFDRNALFNDYARRLKESANVDDAVLTNGISMLRRATATVRSRISFDELLARRLQDYNLSSNRLAYAEEVLAMPSATAVERTYFAAVTNDLKSVGGVLPCVALP